MNRALLVCLGVMGLCGASLSTTASDFGERSATMWSPVVEWTITNSTYDGNPFDIAAKATFRHEASGETHATEFFFAGDNTWKFRFTGTRTGLWRFVTESDDPELTGQAGAILVAPNPDPNARGFLTHDGNRYAIQRGNDARLEGYLFTVYMNGVEFPPRDLTNWDEEKTVRFCRDAKKNGFEIIFVHVNNQWFDLGSLAWNEHDSANPDLRTFAVLENIITTAQREGCRVHFWAWGDESRKWTPKGVPGGINGEADRRLQRYIAARLGPLPGWTMGYGFDLHEWTNVDELNSWADYMHGHFGWQHPLCARGHKLDGPNNIWSYDGFGRNVQLTTTAHGPKSYREIVEDLVSETGHPHLYEERHSYHRDGFDLDMDGTRRLLWWESMAGGMGGFFGFYRRDSGAFAGYPYPNPEQLRTHYTFWRTKGRFRLDFERANGRSESGAYVLVDPASAHWVVYAEDTKSIAINLSKAPGPSDAVAVDLRKAYKEIDRGELKPAKHTIELPETSDWAIAIGEFQER